MGKNKTKTKYLVIAVCCMVVVVAALIVVIIMLNKENEPDASVADPPNNGSITADVSVSNNTNDNIVTPTAAVKDTDISTPTPTEKVEEPVTVTLGEYKGIKADYSPVIITDKDIDNQLKQIASEYTDIVDMPDRPFEDGDMAIVTYKGMLDGKLIDELYVVCLQVVLGRGSLPPTFEDEIIGRRKGDTFTIDMDYPEDYTVLPEIAGKTVSFDVELVDGFVFEIPEINDELISKATQYSTVDEFRTKTMAELQKQQDDIAYQAAIKELKNKIIENAVFSGPIDSEIKKKYVLRINELNAQYQAEYYMDAATYYNLLYGLSPEQYTASVMGDVTLEVKYDYVLQEIAKAEGISVEEADKLVLDLAEINGLEQ